VPAALVAVHVSQVKRRFLEVGSGCSRVEIAFDRGEIVAGDRSVPICEVEYELRSGDPKALVDFARAGIAAHGMWLSTLSKATRGDVLARLAAALRTAARELPREDASAAPSWQALITELFRRLGDHRDRSTVAVSIGRELAIAGSPEPSLGTSADALDPVALLRSREVQLALLDVLAEAMTEQTGPGDVRDDRVEGHGRAGREERAAIAARLGKLHASMKKAARRFDRFDTEERHRVRKRLKRLRYFAELVGRSSRRALSVAISHGCGQPRTRSAPTST
jgi:triphosphatase